MKPHIVLDLSRLMWRADRLTPTGIDRVELSYARYLVANVPERLSFVGWWGRLSLLPSEDAIAMIAALDAGWSGDTLGTAVYDKARRIARKLRMHALLRGGATIYSHLAKIKAPIVYLHVSHYRLYRPDALERLKRRTSARFIFFIHDLIPIEFPEHVPWRHDRKHRRRIENVVRLANCVIVNSNGTKTAFRQHISGMGADVPIVVAPLGVDLRLSQMQATENSGRNYFVCLGTIESRKNHILLLRAWRELAATLGSAAPRLIFVGRRGRKSRDVIATIRAFSSTRELVEIHDRLPDNAVARLLIGARALLYPSFAEGFGLPVAEGLALGVPVLCSDLAELREIGRDVPEYLDPHDTAGWCRVIRDYSEPHSIMREAQLKRLTKWRPTSWDGHFATIRALLDDASPPSALKGSAFLSQTLSAMREC